MKADNSQDKVIRLEKYLADLKNRLSAPVPERHKLNPQGLKDWLNLEIKRTTIDLDGLKLSVK